MKKSVAIIVGLVYVGSIVFIAFFGIKLAALETVIYVNKIECINKELEIDENNIKWILLDYEDGLVYTVEYKVYPENATNSAVEFTYPKSESYEVTRWGEIVFYRPELFTLTIRATDGSNVTESIKIFPKR